MPATALVVEVGIADRLVLVAVLDQLLHGAGIVDDADGKSIGKCNTIGRLPHRQGLGGGTE